MKTKELFSPAGLHYKKVPKEFLQCDRKWNGLKPGYLGNNEEHGYLGNNEEQWKGVMERSTFPS